jgi:hypothetical protein
MDMKRLVIGTIVGSIAFYIIGYLIFDLAFGSYYAANVGSASGVLRTPNLQWALWITDISGALMVTLALEMKGGAISITNALVMGAVIGLLVWLQADGYYYGATNVWNYKILIVDPLLSAVDTAIGAAIIAAVLARVPGAAGLQPAR